MTLVEYIESRKPELLEEFANLHDPLFIEMEAIYIITDTISKTKVTPTGYNLLEDGRKFWRFRKLEDTNTSEAFESDKVHYKLKKISNGNGTIPKDTRRNRWIEVKGKRVFMHISAVRDIRGKLLFGLTFTDHAGWQHRVKTVEVNGKTLFDYSKSKSGYALTNSITLSSMKDIKEHIFGNRHINLDKHNIDDLLTSLEKDLQ